MFRNVTESYLQAQSEGRHAIDRLGKGGVERYKVIGRSRAGHIVQELCESRGGRPGLSVLTSLLVSVNVKIY